MLSSKDATKVWRHDATENRNAFYGLPPQLSSVEVSFNDLPSDIKIFNSVSAETNANTITASFFINDELRSLPTSNGSVTETTQLSSFIIGEEAHTFKDREGFKYVDVPRIGTGYFTSSGNGDGDSNIIYMGALSLDFSLLDGSFFEEQNGPYQFKARLSKSSDISIPVGRYNPNNIAEFHLGPTLLIASNNSFNQCNFDVATQQDVIVEHNTSSYAISGLASTTNLNSLFVVAQDRDIITLEYSRRHNSFYGETVDPFVPGELFLSDPFSTFLDGNKLLFVETPPGINGEQLRGPYMRVRYNFIGSKYMELHAVNADYDISTYHHSLTQNT